MSGAAPEVKCVSAETLFRAGSVHHLRAAGGERESFDWLCLGITNISATRIPAVGILSRPLLVAMVNAPVLQKQFLADT